MIVELIDGKLAADFNKWFLRSDLKVGSEGFAEAA
jgi:hypothetical protein